MSSTKNVTKNVNDTSAASASTSIPNLNAKSKTQAKAKAKDKEFLEIKPTEAQAVYKLYIAGLADNKSPEEIAPSIAAFLITTYHLTPFVAENAAARVLQNFSENLFQETLIDQLVSSAVSAEVEHATPHITISLEDYQKFTEFIQADPDVTLPLKKLLLSFIVFYRYNYHPSGWIKYDKKNIFHLAGVSKLSSAAQEKMTAYLHTHYGLNMRVVGSNQPTPCYSLSWLQEQQPPGSPDNPWITLGAMTPQDLLNVVLKIK